jgi:cobalamin biosynthesis protein CobD/CbiB
VDSAHYIIGGLWGALLFLVGVVWKISENKAASLTTKVDANAADLAKFELAVAKEYVSRDTLREMEERITKAIEAVGETQQRIFDELKGKADK